MKIPSSSIADRPRFRVVFLAVALVLVITSVAHGTLHVIEFMTQSQPDPAEGLVLIILQVLSPLAAAVILISLAVRDWGTARRAERSAQAANERAAEAAGRLNEAVEVINQGFVLFDAEDRLIHCNSKYRELYQRCGPFTPGTPFETLVRRGARLGLYADCDPNDIEEWMERRLAAHRAPRGPIEQRLRDGRWLRIEERRTADGGNVGVRTDITELKRRESDLAAKSAVLETTFGAMEQGVLVWDPNRRLIAHNQRVEELLELPKGLLRPTTTLNGLMRYLAERGEYGPGDPETVAGKRREKLNFVDGSSHEHTRPNGRILEVRVIPVPNGAVLLTFIDMTERRAVETSLRESEERFRELSDSAVEGIIAHDNGTIIDANRAAGELMRMPAEEMIDRHLFDFIVADHHTRVAERLAKREESRIELPCLRRDGVRITVEAQNRYVQHRGRLVSMVSFRDVTEQRRAEAALRRAKEEAEQASRSKNDFVRTISHELRTPMNGVLGMLDLLQEGDLREPLKGFAATAHASAESMLGLLDDLLDFSKIEAGRLSFDIERFDAGGVVEAATEAVAARAAEKGLALAVVIPSERAAMMTADPSRLRQVLLNLVGNAIKFTDKGGIVVGVEHDAIVRPDQTTVPALRFDIRDSGIGIGQAARARLFGEFVQVHDGRRPGVSGTGLGLAISKRLVELMGGSIGVDSVPGVGSRFWFILPTGAEPASAEPVPAAAGSAPPSPETPIGAPEEAPLRGIVAAVVDATAIIRSALARQIAGWGADVIPCASMEEAAIGIQPGDEGHAALLRALTAGTGVAATGAPPKGMAAIIFQRDGETRCLILRPVGAAMTPNHPRTDTLEWPARPSGLLAALSGVAADCGRHPARTTRPAPLMVVPTHQADHAAATTPEPPTARLGRILLAEDSETNRQVARAFLERAGYDVTMAINGHQAVEAVEGMAFDAILMDVGMPEMDGLEATRRIRALPPPAGVTPIIALTADAALEDRGRCLDNGMDDHIVKPLDRANLLRIVAEWVERGGGRVENPTPNRPHDPLPRQSRERPEGEALDDVTVTQLRRDLDAEVLEGLIRQFLDETAGRIDRIAAAVGSGDIEVIRRESHTLKSTAGTFGARHLNRLAREIEIICQNEGDPEFGRRIVDASEVLAPLLHQAADAYRSGGHLN